MIVGIVEDLLNDKGRELTSGFASKAGISESLAKGGLEQVVPLVSSALEPKAGGVEGIVGLLGGEGASGVLGAVGELFKR